MTTQIIQGTYTSDGAARTIELPTGCDRFEIYNYTNQGSSAATGVVKKAHWFRGMASASAFVVKNTDSAATDQSSVITTGGFTYFDAASEPTFASQTITSITQANPAVVTVTSHGYATGDLVRFINVTGMQQISSMIFSITVTGANTFTIPLNTSGFAAAATGGSVRKIASAGLFAPRIVLPTAITQASSAVVSTNIPHGLEVGSKVTFRVSSAYGMTQIDSLVGEVTAVGSTTSFTVNIDSSAFTAFAYPTSATAAAGVTQAQVVPVGTESILTDQTFNSGTIGITLGTSVVGASSDVVYYVGYKANKAAGE